MTSQRLHFSPAVRERWTAIGLVSLVAVLTYGLLIPWLGFYRDDWYQLWAGLTLGPRSIVTLFSIDRPVMGYTYAATFSLLRDSAIAWQLYALFLRWLGALGALWLFRRLWPGRPLITTSAALLFLVYPGFLQQPNADTFSNHLLSYTAAVLSLAATAEAMASPRGWRRLGLTVFAVAGALTCWLTYEYMIGLEVLRYIILARAALEGIGRPNRRWFGRFAGAAAPYLIALAAFLYWRLAVFEASRIGVSVDHVLSKYETSLWLTLLQRAGILLGDFVEASLFGWFVPGYDRLLDVEAGQVVIGLLPTAVAVLAFLWWARARNGGPPEAPSTTPAEPDPARELTLIGGLTTLACLTPVVLADREIRWSSAFDRYTLHATLGVAMLTVGLVWTVFQARLRPAVLAFLLGLSVLAHQANAFHWARFWDEQRQLWWQLSWRAPGLQPGTVLLVNLPSQRYFEDYEVWGPANLIYAPDDRTPNLAAQVIEEETARKVQLGAQETRYMRVLIGIPRDYRSTLMVDWPSRQACVHVLGANQPEAGVTSGSLVRSMASFSKEDRVLPDAEPARPPERIFGAEPERNWCWYYQRASLARQTADWAFAADLGREAQAEGFSPSDRSEWMPFFQAYVNLGHADEAAHVADLILEDPPVAEQICSRLGVDHFSDDKAYQQAHEMLCREAD
jgi:hypothetical protein